MGTKLYVGNLNYNTTEQSLRDAFGADGREVASVSIIMDRETGRSRGFAFVEMATPEGAQQALQALDGQDLDGRMLRINEARERDARGPGGGGGGYSPRPGGGGGFSPRPGGGGFGGPPGGGGGFGGPPGGGGGYRPPGGPPAGGFGAPRPGFGPPRPAFNAPGRGGPAGRGRSDREKERGREGPVDDKKARKGRGGKFGDDGDDY